jgi:hypothetical protein
MKTRIIIGVVGISMMIAIAWLWIRVRELESSVASLIRQLSTKPNVVTVTAPQFPQLKKGEGDRIFKLIDSASPDSGKSPAGVPWEIERGMLLDGAERNQRSAPMQLPRGSWQIEGPIEPINPQNLKHPISPLLETPTESKTD